jgi:hypothetical protein
MRTGSVPSSRRPGGSLCALGSMRDMRGAAAGPGTPPEPGAFRIQAALQTYPAALPRRR